MIISKAYRNNEMGMPTKITKFASVPLGMTLSESYRVSF